MIKIDVVWIYTHRNHSQKLQREYAPYLVENIGREENTTCYKLQINFVTDKLLYIQCDHLKKLNIPR